MSGLDAALRPRTPLNLEGLHSCWNATKFVASRSTTHLNASSSVCRKTSKNYIFPKLSARPVLVSQTLNETKCDPGNHGWLHVHEYASPGFALGFTAIPGGSHGLSRQRLCRATTVAGPASRSRRFCVYPPGTPLLCLFSACLTSAPIKRRCVSSQFEKENKLAPSDRSQEHQIPTPFR